MKGLVVAIGIATGVIGIVVTGYAQDLSFEDEITVPTIEQCQELAEIDATPIRAVRPIDVTAEPGGSQLRAVVVTYQELDQFVTQATNTLLPFIDKWSLEVERSDDGEWRLKEGVMEALVSESVVEHDCIITVAQLFVEQVTREDFNKAIIAGILVASGLVDFFQRFEEGAETEYDRGRFRILKSRMAISRNRFEFLQESLQDEIELLEQVISTYKRDRVIAGWLFLAGEVEAAADQLEQIVASIRDFRELVEARRRALISESL